MIEDVECYVKLASASCRDLSAEDDEQCALLADAEGHLNQALLKVRAWQALQPKPTCRECGEPVFADTPYCEEHGPPWDD